MPKASNPPEPIQLRIDQIGHLFESLDPFPIQARDLSRSAEDYIVSWARELPRQSPITIVLHMPQASSRGGEASAVQDAFKLYFSDRAEVALRELKDLLRVGRLSAVIGLGALAVSVAGGQIILALLGAGSVARFLTEGLFILGWVANWRPLEIFLYDWWPLAQRRRLYRRLAEAPVELRVA